MATMVTMTTSQRTVISSTNMGGVVGSIVVVIIDRCAWFSRVRLSANMLKKLQGPAALPISSNLTEDHWPNHAHPVSFPFQTTSAARGLMAYLCRLTLLYPSPFHKLIPRFWVHQAWWPLTP